MTTAVSQTSPLHSLHVALGAKLIDFHGWTLPVQYTSVLDEHQAVRQSAGLFDISHMGQVLVTGEGAFDFLQGLVTSDLRRSLEKGIGVYAHLCLPSGGIIDDIFVYVLNAKEIFVVVNSATHAKDVAWLRDHVKPGISIVDIPQRAALAIQGPKALEIIRRTLAGVAELPRFAFQKMPAASPRETLWACRTGYTGEEGAEFFGPVDTIKTLWKQFTENGTDFTIKPCGLGARDTLRLEMGYALYGQELTEERTPLEANLAWVVKWDKGDFIGRQALEAQKTAGLKTTLLAYEMIERGVPRHGAAVFCNGDSGGETTSGTFSPSLQKGIGLAYAPSAWNVPGTPLEIELYGRRLKAQVVRLPFYKK